RFTTTHGRTSQDRDAICHAHAWPIKSYKYIIKNVARAAIHQRSCRSRFSRTTAPARTRTTAYGRQERTSSTATRLTTPHGCGFVSPEPQSGGQPARDVFIARVCSPATKVSTRRKVLVRLRMLASCRQPAVRAHGIDVDVFWSTCNNSRTNGKSNFIARSSCVKFSVS